MKWSYSWIAVIKWSGFSRSPIVWIVHYKYLTLIIGKSSHIEMCWGKFPLSKLTRMQNVVSPKMFYAHIWSFRNAKRVDFITVKRFWEYIGGKFFYTHLHLRLSFSLINIHTHIHTNINTHICTIAHTHMNIIIIHTHMNTHTNEHTNINTHICTIAHTHMNTHTHNNTHWYEHTHTHNNTHTYEHTHMNTCSHTIKCIEESDDRVVCEKFAETFEAKVSPNVCTF